MKAWLAAGLALIAVGACASGPPTDIHGVPIKPVFAGYLRQGFEQSDFYPADDLSAGPWWVSLEESEQPKLDRFASGEGRGRAIVVEVLVQASKTGPVDFGIRPAFANSLQVHEVLSVKPMSEAAFQDVVERARGRR